LRHRLDGGRKFRLAQTESDARAEESAHARHQGVAERGQAPGGDRCGIADLGSEAVHEGAEQHEADGIGALESRVDLSELLVGPSELAVQDGLEQRQDLPIHVVDRRRQE
jgi:hypothetical protein